MTCNATLQVAESPPYHLPPNKSPPSHTSRWLLVHSTRVCICIASTSHTQTRGSIGSTSWDTDQEAKSPKIFRACLRARRWWLCQWHSITETSTFRSGLAALRLLHPVIPKAFCIPKATEPPHRMRAPKGLHGSHEEWGIRMAQLLSPSFLPPPLIFVGLRQACRACSMQLDMRSTSCAHTRWPLPVLDPPGSSPTCRNTGRRNA